MEEREFSFTRMPGDFSGLAMYEQTDPLCSIEVGAKCIVIYDGVEYKCSVQELDGNIGIGNPYFYTGNNSDDNGIPFILYNQSSKWGAVIYSNGSSTEEHTIAIYEEITHSVTLIPEQTFTFTKGSLDLLDHLAVVQQQEEFFPLIEGVEYVIFFDGIGYKCTAVNYDGFIMLGNPYIANGNELDNTGEPFIIGILNSSQGSEYIFAIKSNGSNTESHRVAVYKKPQTFHEFTYDNTYGAYIKGTPSAFFPIELGKTYTVIWDDIEYTCTSQYLSAFNVICVGNCSGFGGSGNNEPFVISYDEINQGNMFFSTDTKEYHAILVYEKEDNTNDDRSTLLEQTTIDGFFFEGDRTDISFYIEQRDLSNLVYGNSYTVSWNGSEYNCRCYNDGYGSKVLGNSSFDYGQDTGEPFVICYYPDSGEVLYASYEARTSNTVAIYGDSAGVVLGDVILEETSVMVMFCEASIRGKYIYNLIEDGVDYVVVWDGTEYVCNGYYRNREMFIGNPSHSGLGTTTGEPFLVEMTESSTIVRTDEESDGTHTIAIYKKA
jgi:hypothetical protein